MSQVSRPMQIALVATMAFALVWFVALRPKSSSGGEAASAPQTTPAAPGTAGLSGAIDKAHDAVTTADADAQRAAGDGGQAPASGAAAGGGTTGSSAGIGAAPAHRRAVGAPVLAVRSALRQHKAVAIAFVDPNTADARAVAQEMRHVSTFGGRAVALAVPLVQLSDYGFITNEVEVTVAPTVVIVDRRRRASTIVGFADRGEIEQRLADAVAVKPR